MAAPLRYGLRGKMSWRCPARMLMPDSSGQSKRRTVFGRTAALNNQRHGPGGKKKDTGDKHRNSANCEDTTRMQIIALMLHCLAFDVRRRRCGGWRPGGDRLEQRPFRASNIKICTNTRGSDAEFSPETVTAGGGAFWHVVLPTYLG